GMRRREAGQEAEPWDAPLPIGHQAAAPPFPVSLLPEYLADWTDAEATATQTPPDLAGLLAIAVAGAGIAGKIRVSVRKGWSEPTNIFVVPSLLPGERKSAVFSDAIAPVQAFEAEERTRLIEEIAKKETEHRRLENQLKAVERGAAEAEAEEAEALKTEAMNLAKKLAEHEVPELPQFYCDDATPEYLGKLLARQGGRMLQTAAEGTALEIAKGRYSDGA